MLARAVQGRGLRDSRRRSSACATPTRWSGSAPTVRTRATRSRSSTRATSFAASEFGITKPALAAGGRVRGIKVPGGAALSRKQVDEIEAIAKSAGAGGLLRLKRGAAGLEGPAAKFLSEGGAQRLATRRGRARVCSSRAPMHVSNPALDRVRQDVAQRLSLVPENKRVVSLGDRFSAVRSASRTARSAAVHHPFTAPHPDDLTLLESAPEKVRALAYDVVLNGTGAWRRQHPHQRSGAAARRSSRCSASTRRRRRLASASCSTRLRAGAPPHGGIAFGFDRIAMVLAGASSLRDVIAFPKTTAARALFEDAPSAVPPEDLRDLHLQNMKS